MEEIEKQCLQCAQEIEEVASKLEEVINRDRYNRRDILTTKYSKQRFHNKCMVIRDQRKRKYIMIHCCQVRDTGKT